MACAEQQTPEWFAARIGCLTASKAAAVLKRGRDGKPLKAYYDLIDEIIAERTTGIATEHAFTRAMEWGVEHEDEARSRYEAERAVFVTETGFVKHPTIEYLGASPDGLVGDDGLLEIKCPNTTTHLRRMRAGVVPEEYVPQMLVQLICTDRKWVDFVSYDPRILGEHERFQFFVIRYEPSKEELEDAERKCREFLKEVEAEMARLLEM